MSRGFMKPAYGIQNKDGFLPDKNDSIKIIRPKFTRQDPNTTNNQNIDKNGRFEGN